MKFCIHSIFATLILLQASQSFAQQYQCTRSNGTVFRSAQPCPKDGFVYYGPTGNETPRITVGPGARPAGEELQYLSSECSRIYEGIRTSRARGVGHEDIASLQREFQLKCSEELGQARRKLYESKQEQRQTQLDQQRSKQQQTARVEAEEKSKRAQCAEMRNGIATRKERSNMTDNEKADLAVFEQRYRDRCY
jgi:hypothetical protein